MTLSVADRQALTELVALHGHLFDEGELDRLDELFTADVTYDVSDLGFPAMVGIDTIRDAALALGDRNPVTHLVTNCVVTEIDADTAAVRSKGLGLNADGTIGSVTYVDTAVRTPAGWRLQHRSVRARRHPLGGLGTNATD